MTNKFPKPVQAYAAVWPDGTMSLSCYEHAGQNPLAAIPHSKWQEIPVTILPTEQYEAMQWQPIANAKRDGTYYLVTRLPFTGNRPPFQLVRWGRLNYSKGHAEGWKISRYKLCRWEPTHYLQLPSVDIALAALKEHDHV